MKILIVLYFILLAPSFSVFAQKKNKKEVSNIPATLNIDSVAQQIAINFGDYDKAITFGYRLLAKDFNNVNKF